MEAQYKLLLQKEEIVSQTFPENPLDFAKHNLETSVHGTVYE